MLSNNKNVTCESVVNINDIDYEYCSINFNNNVSVIILKGKGKFQGLNICKGTSIGSKATNEECPTFFEEDSREEIVGKVKSGIYTYQVGDTKRVDLGETLGTHTIRVSNTTPCSEVSVLSKTACGFVLEFKDIITTYNMNANTVETFTSAGGWPKSEMNDFVNGTIYNVIPEELRNGIIDTYVISSHGNQDITPYENVVEGNFYSTDKLYLLSPQEVYGTSFTNRNDSSNGTSRQLDYYATYEGEGYTGVGTTNYVGAIKKSGSTDSQWWLRSASGSTSFWAILSNGSNSGISSYDYNCVFPAFRLAD